MGATRGCLATLLPSVEAGWQPLSTQQLPKHTHKNTNEQGTFQNHFRTIFALNQNPVATAGFTSCHQACVGGGTFLENGLSALCTHMVLLPGQWHDGHHSGQDSAL